MTTAKPSQGQDWLDSQKDQWDKWFADQRAALDARLDSFNGMQSQWDGLFKDWRRSAGAAMSGGQTSAPPRPDAFAQHFARAGQDYLSMMQHFANGSAAQKPEETLQNWMGNMQRFFEMSLMQQAHATDPAALSRAFAEGLIQLSPALWESFFRQPSAAAPGRHAGMFDPLGVFAEMPGIGYTREKQEHAARLYQQWTEYETAARRYYAEMTKVGLLALSRFQEYLQNPPRDAKPLSSLKDIYAKWVDVCEEVYARYAMSEDYTRLYGEVVNHQMALRKQVNDMIDEAAAQMNLPTRKEVDSLHMRVHEMRRENARLRKMMEERFGTAPAAAPSPPAPKGARRKTTAKTAAKPAGKAAPQKQKEKPKTKAKAMPKTKASAKAKTRPQRKGGRR